MSRKSRSLSNAFNQEANEEKVTVKPTQENEQKDVTLNSNTETVTEREIQNSDDKTVKSATEQLLNKYDAKIKKPRIEDTHTRTTFLFRNDLRDRLDKLSEDKSRGFKTIVMNEAIEAILDELERSN